jgi:methionyl-tRNA formyltransferase
VKHPAKDLQKRVAVVGCKHTTEDLIMGLNRYALRVDHVVTIAQDKAAEQQVAGYKDLRPLLHSMGIPYTVACKYSLQSDEDRRAVLALNVDMLLVMGWQRLIPDWWLEALSIGAFGMHGSFKPLPHGRGRSPMNWSLLQGRTLFFTHLFQYLPGVDDGPVVGQQMFELTPFDTCLTAHFKNQTAMLKLCVRLLPGLLDGTAPRRPQPRDVQPSHWPKRTAEDGLIYWHDTTTEIYNLVRAVTKPFPGAFTYLHDDPAKKVIVWRAIPFDKLLDYGQHQHGEVVEAFYDGSFVVKTGDTTLLVLESEGHRVTAADVGARFGTLGIPRKTWPELPP